MVCTHTKTQDCPNLVLLESGKDDAVLVQDSSILPSSSRRSCSSCYLGHSRPKVSRHGHRNRVLLIHGATSRANRQNLASSSRSAAKCIPLLKPSSEAQQASVTQQNPRGCTAAMLGKLICSAPTEQLVMVSRWLRTRHEGDEAGSCSHSPARGVE